MPPFVVIIIRRNRRQTRVDGHHRARDGAGGLIVAREEYAESSSLSRKRPVSVPAGIVAVGAVGVPLWLYNSAWFRLDSN